MVLDIVISTSNAVFVANSLEMKVNSPATYRDFMVDLLSVNSGNSILEKTKEFS